MFSGEAHDVNSVDNTDVPKHNVQPAFMNDLLSILKAITQS